MEMSADEGKKRTGAFPTLSPEIQFFVLQWEEIKGAKIYIGITCHLVWTALAFVWGEVNNWYVLEYILFGILNSVIVAHWGSDSGCKSIY